MKTAVSCWDIWYSKISGWWFLQENPECVHTVVLIKIQHVRPMSIISNACNSCTLCIHHAYVFTCICSTLWSDMCVPLNLCYTNTISRAQWWLADLSGLRSWVPLQLQLVCKALMECMLPHVQWHILAYQYINMCYCDYKCVINWISIYPHSLIPHITSCHLRTYTSTLCKPPHPSPKKTVAVNCQSVWWITLSIAS